MPKRKYSKFEVEAYYSVLQRRYEELLARTQDDDSQFVSFDEMIVSMLDNDMSPEEEGLLDEVIALRLSENGYVSDKRRSGDKETIWNNIMQLIGRKHKPNYARAVRLVAAGIAVILVIGTLTFGVASAFNWEFLLRIFRPGNETAGQIVNFEPYFGHDAVDKPEYHEELMSLLAEDINAQMDFWYDTFESMPKHLYSLSATLQELPDGVSFSHGEVVERFDQAVSTSTFYYGNDEFTLRSTVYKQESVVENIVYEMNADSGEILIINGREVMIFENANIRFANWSDMLAVYDLWGNLDIQQMEELIKAIYGG